MAGDVRGTTQAGGSGRTLIFWLSLIGFFAIFSTTISKNPVLPLYATALGATDTLLGLIAAISPLAGILFSFPVGVLSDRLGRRRLLVASGIVFLISPLLYLLVADPVALIPIRFFHGTATAILGPVVSAIIAERFPATKGEMLGTYSSATLVGRTLAPLAGGVIISAFMFMPGAAPYRVVYIAAAVAAVPVLVLILRYRDERETAQEIPGFSVFRESLRAFLTNASLRATALADTATYFAFGAVETFLPVYLLALGFAAWQIGAIFAVQVLVIAATKPFFGRFADRADKRYQIAAGVLVTGSAAAAIPLVAGFWEILAVSAAFGLGMSFSTVATSAFVADVAKRDQIGASMGALSSIMDIGQSAGPFVTGIVITLAGYTAGFLAGFVLALAVIAVFAVSVREGGTPPTPPA